MELSNLVWHSGAALFALWACFTALGAKRRLEGCETVLLPALLLPDAAQPNGLVLSLRARVKAFVEAELRTLWGCPVQVVAPESLSPAALRRWTSGLWTLVRSARKETPWLGLLEWDGVSIDPAAVPGTLATREAGKVKSLSLAWLCPHENEDAVERTRFSLS